MEKPLKRIVIALYHIKDGKRIYGAHAGLWGNCTGLSGDCSGLRGICSELRGDCSGLNGDLDLIPMEARKEHPDISYWVQQPTSED